MSQLASIKERKSLCSVSEYKDCWTHGVMLMQLKQRAVWLFEDGHWRKQSDKSVFITHSAQNFSHSCVEKAKIFHFGTILKIFLSFNVLAFKCFFLHSNMLLFDVKRAGYFVNRLF